MSDARRPVRIALLGGFTVSVEGVVVPPRWRLRKAKTIVKLLALAAGHRVHRDVLIEQLWPEADPAVGANNFHQALHAARRVVGAENLVLHDEIVVLGGEGGVAVDVDDFDAAAARAASTGAPEDHPPRARPVVGRAPARGPLRGLGRAAPRPAERGPNPAWWATSPVP